MRPVCAKAAAVLEATPMPKPKRMPRLLREIVETVLDIPLDLGGNAAPPLEQTPLFAVKGAEPHARRSSFASVSCRVFESKARPIAQTGRLRAR